MESGQMIEATGESQTRPISSISKDVHDTPSQKLHPLSFSSSSSDSSHDGSFEFTPNVSSVFLNGTNDHLKDDNVCDTGDLQIDHDSTSDDMETHPTADLSNEMKVSNQLSSKSLSTATDSSPLGDAPLIASPSVVWSVDDPVVPQKAGQDSDTEFIEPDVNLTFPVFPSAKHADTGTGSLMMQPGSEFGEADDNTRSKVLQASASSSSSSSSECELDILIQPGEDATNHPSTHNHGSLKVEKDRIPVSDITGDDIPISSRPINGQSAPGHKSESSSDSESATQYPPTQTMERAEDSTPSPYRIPSRVFTRTKSTAPVEWSVASNESLFSIHTGNMSFTREQLCWLGKSGELCRVSEMGMSPLIDLPSHHQPLIIKPSDNGLHSTHAVGEPVVTEATAAETMRQVIRENSENKLKENPRVPDMPTQSASLSHHSEGSTKSFQFPILAGDGGKCMSMTVETEKPKQQMPPESPRPTSSNPQTPKEANAGQSPRLSPDGGQRRWLSCFSCCPFCS